VGFVGVVDLAEKTRRLPVDPVEARTRLLEAFVEHGVDPGILPAYEPREGHSVTLIAMHVHDAAIVLAVPDDVMSEQQREAVREADGGWYDHFPCYDGSAEAYAAALRLCAWAGYEGDDHWADNRGDAMEYFAEEGDDPSVLPTSFELARSVGIWSPYIVLGGHSSHRRLDLLAERPSRYTWLCWRA
jgi:hypothetical protein